MIIDLQGALYRPSRECKLWHIQLVEPSDKLDDDVQDCQLNQCFKAGNFRFAGQPGKMLRVDLLGLEMFTC